MNRVGIFGGTFAPFHNGHLRALEIFLKQAELDRCLVIPAGTPPHKEKPGLFTDRQRLHMTRRACAGIPRCEVWDGEIRKQGRSYTSETVARLHALYPDARLVLYLGSDMFLSFQDWHEPQQIVNGAELFVLSRTGDDREALEKHKQVLAARFKNFACRVDEGEPIVLSSTLIREKWCAGKDVSALVPRGVAVYLDRLRKKERTQ